MRFRLSPRARRDRDRLDGFLRTKSSRAATAALRAIYQGIENLLVFPMSGRPVSSDAPEIRDWIVRYRNSGYVIRYRITSEFIVIVAIRHSLEAGF
jgi:plasmid stabilization system protein ParE